MKHLPALLLLFSAFPLFAADPGPAAQAVNALGLDLERAMGKGEANLCLSPYSIQTALAMTYAGSDGATHAEMAKALHFPADDKGLPEAFAAIAEDLEVAKAKSVERVKEAKRVGGPSEPIVVSLANRLFGQKGFGFKAPFLEELDSRYHAPLEQIDFKSDPDGVRRHINGWVEEQTHQRIRELIPSGAVSSGTRLALANALYLKAPWEKEFTKGATQPAPFHVHGAAPENVPTMVQMASYGYARENGFTAVAMPYSGDGLQFLILLPNQSSDLHQLEAKLTPALLAKCAKLKFQDVILYLPKFKLESASLALKPQLEALGMKTAFDDPKGSADFGKMAPRRPDDYLTISEVFHKTYIAIDEQGTEAAAATVVLMAEIASAHAEPPAETVRVDRPFFFAVQDVASGACPFLGRVTDPR